MRKLLLIALLSAAIGNTAPMDPIKLWPKGVPGSQPLPGSEHDMTTAKDNLVMGQPVIRITYVADPTLTFYPATGVKNGATVLVFPGGGYRVLAYDLEGTEICQWLNSIGVNAALVKYRVPPLPGAARYTAPLQDAQRALSLVREHAAEWHLDPNHIGVMGFSAGGHLAALVSNQASGRPNFVILIYPAYLVSDKNHLELAPEITVTHETPITFIVQTEDDLYADNSLGYYRALKEANVPAELHLFAKGGHGYGLRPDPAKPVTQWPKLAESWLINNGLLVR
jgi:acetyl esterase/lipase